MTALNPTMTIGAQIAEAILIHEPKSSKDAVWKRVLELMELVGIDRPAERACMYPWNFSGGMRQRSVLAIALAANPAILIADEPTTALDVTIQDTFSAAGFPHKRQHFALSQRKADVAHRFQLSLWGVKAD